jgi:hypothetical protein
MTPAALSPAVMVEERAQAFETFFASHEPALRRALTAAFGTAIGREAALDALA